MGCLFGCCPSSDNNNKKRLSDNLKPTVTHHQHHHHHHQHDTNNTTPSSSLVNNDASAAKQPSDVNNPDAIPHPLPSVTDVTVAGNNTSTSKARTFSYQELVDATANFRSDSFLGEGGFGKVYKGRLLDTGEVYDKLCILHFRKQIVAIKQLDRNGMQGIREFVVEVLTLGLADHPNLVKLIGYCAEGAQRLLVYEYMPLGSLERHLHDLRLNQRTLDWSTRMKIAAGAARGLEYLHDKMNPPVIYRDLKCSNILLGEEYHPKLSDFGLAKVGPVGDKTHVSTRVMGTYGYCAPDYAMTGQLTFKSDIYSFGVVLLEIITGRKAIDSTKDSRDQNLVAWARPLFKNRKKFPEMADPALEGRYPPRGLYQALAVAAMCVQEQPSMRPLIHDIVKALDFLVSQISEVRSSNA